MKRYIPLFFALGIPLICGASIVVFKSLSHDRDQKKAISFVSTMNEICGITEFDTDMLHSVILPHSSERIESVQSVYMFLLHAHRNDDSVLEKLLDYRDYIWNRGWIDLYLWVDFDNTTVKFSTYEFSQDIELAKEADELIRELSHQADL